MAYSIGLLSFDDLVGDVLQPADGREAEAKNGVDGVAIFEIGRRGGPFELRSEYAFATWADAKAAEITYANAFTSTPVNIVVGSYDYTSSGLAFVVLGVKTTVESVVAYHCTRGVIRPAFVVRAVWQLFSVEV